MRLLKYSVKKIMTKLDDGYTRPECEIRFKFDERLRDAEIRVFPVVVNDVNYSITVVRDCNSIPVWRVDCHDTLFLNTEGTTAVCGQHHAPSIDDVVKLNSALMRELSKYITKNYIKIMEESK